MFCATARSVLMHFKRHEKYQFFLYKSRCSVNYSPHVWKSETDLDSGFHAMDSGSLVSGIPDSSSCILDSKAQNFRFRMQKFPGFQIPQAKILHCRFTSDTLFYRHKAFYKRFINMFSKVGFMLSSDHFKNMKNLFFTSCCTERKKTTSHERRALKGYTRQGPEGF